MIDMAVIAEKNNAPPVERVWMFVSRDAQGRENVCGSLMGELGVQPLMTGNPRILEIMKPLAARAASLCEGSGQTLHLLCFTQREEVEGWR